MNVPLQRMYFDKEEEKAVNLVLRSGWVTQGPKVQEFEEAVKEFTGAKYAVATTSCTTALFLSLKVLGIGPGDEVIVPSFSFIATTNVVVQVGAKPVFVDIDPQTYNIDPQKIIRAITKKTKAIIPVDQVGLPFDWNNLRDIARKYKLFIIEDAACALGSVYRGQKIGSFGDLVCLSFHPRKIITTGEGGMVLTSNKTFADKLRALRHHGMSVSDVQRHNASKVIFEKYPIVGYNFRMSDIQAAIGVEQMKKLPEILKKRSYLAERYTRKLQACKLLTTPYVPEGYIHNRQSYIIRLKPNAKITRNQLMQKLLDSGITVRIGIMAAHLEKPYREMYPKLSLPETEAAAKETITLPLYPQMTKKEQDYVIKKVFFF